MLGMFSLYAIGQEMGHVLKHAWRILFPTKCRMEGSSALADVIQSLPVMFVSRNVIKLDLWLQFVGSCIGIQLNFCKAISLVHWPNEN